MITLKTELNNIIEEIINQENELEKCLNNKENQSIFQNISQNKKKINSLKSLITKEEKISTDKINILTTEISNIEKEISELSRPKTNYTRKDLELNNNKEKFILKAIESHQVEISSLEENLKLLKEEKLSYSYELLNLMSTRENYEELINSQLNRIFKKTKKASNINYIKNDKVDYELNKINEISNYIYNNDNNDNNDSINNLNIEYHDIQNITSINKICNYLYQILSEYISLNLNFISSNNMNLKNIIFTCTNNTFNKYNMRHFNKPNDFIRDLSINIVNYDININNLLIQSQFEILLKYVFKFFSLEKTINDELKFVNNDYVINKKYFKEKLETVKGKINDCNKQLNAIKNEKENIKNDCKEIEEFNNKLTEYKNLINVKINEINKIQNEKNYNEKIYMQQIKNLEMTNQNFENHYNEKLLLAKSKNINIVIENLFLLAKKKIKDLGEKQREEFIKSMIEEINQTVDNINNPKNNIDFNISNYAKKINYNNNVDNSISIIKNSEKNLLKEDLINETTENLFYEINNSTQDNINDINNCSQISNNENYLSSYDSFDAIKSNTNNHMDINDNNNFEPINDINLYNKNKKFSSNKNIHKSKPIIEYNDYFAVNTKNKNIKKNTFGNKKTNILIPEIDNISNNNNNNNIELNHTDINFKYNKEIILDKDTQRKIEKLYKPCECYSQLVYSDIKNYFHPLKDYDTHPESKNFIKTVIQLNKNNVTLMFNQLNKESFDININLIDKTLVTSTMKTIIGIVQLYEKQQNKDINEILNNKKIKEKFNKDEIIKSVYNRHYCFSIYFTIGKKINLIFNNFYEFKNWLNGTATLYKNKKLLLQQFNQSN